MCIILLLYLGFSRFSCSVMSESLQPHGLQHARLPCPSPTPGACSNSCPLSRWCHSIASSSVVPFSSCLQSFPASGSFPVSRLFTSGGQSIGASASASVLPMNIQLTIKELSVCAKSLQSCLTLQQHGLKPARFLSPWDSPGKNIGVGCHALL